MKTLTTITAAAMLIAGMSFASAQNAAGPTGTTANPSNLNAASPGESQIKHSGSQAADPAMKSKPSTTGAASSTTSPTDLPSTTSPASTNAKPSNSTGQ